MTERIAPLPDHLAEHQTSEEYWYIFGAAMALSALVGIYGFVGWAEGGEWFKAVLCLVAQIVSNCSAILGRRAWSKGMFLMGGGAFVVAVGFAYWSGLALEHAWARHGEEPNPAAVWFLAGVEPFLFMAAEHVKRAKPIMWGKAFAGVWKWLGLGASAALIGAPALASERPITYPTETLANVAANGAPSARRTHAASSSKTRSRARAVSAHAEPTEFDRARARTMIDSGMDVCDVHRETNVPKGTLRRWRFESKPANIPLANT